MRCRQENLATLKDSAPVQAEKLYQDSNFTLLDKIVFLAFLALLEEVVVCSVKLHKIADPHIGLRYSSGNITLFLSTPIALA